MEGKFDGIDRKFDAIEGRFDGIDGKFDAIDRRFEGVDIKFDGIYKRLDNIDCNLQEVNDKLDSHFEEIGELKVEVTKIHMLFEKKVDQKDHDKLVHRTDKLESLAFA